MTAAERIEEAHGLWELAAQRVCALAELTITDDIAAKLREASTEEREALTHWRVVSDQALDDARKEKR